MSFITLHPLLNVECLICSCVAVIYVCGCRVWLRNLIFMAFVGFFLICIMPLFSHRGHTPIFFINDSPVTLESVIYGIVMTVMLLSAYQWLSVLSYFLDSEKLLYLVGRLSPTLALLISMILRTIPDLKYRYAMISDAHRGMGRYGENMPFAGKISLRTKEISSLLSTSLEQSGERAAAMEARSYGRKKRTAFSMFVFKKRDAIVFVVVLAAMIFMFYSVIAGSFAYEYYPYVRYGVDFRGVVAMVVYGCLSILAVISGNR